MLELRNIGALALALLMFASGVVVTHAAQTVSGTLYGIVTDGTGAPQAGVRVTAVNTDTAQPRTTISGADGSYTIQRLIPGRYTVRASKVGFREYEATGAFEVTLNKQSLYVPPIRLTSDSAPAATPVATTTMVATTPTTAPAPAATQSEGAPLINLSDPTRRGNFSEREVETLPLGGISELRTYDDLALLLPGVALPPYVAGVPGPGIGTGVGRAGQFSVNGLRSRANNFTVDGSDNNDPDVGVRRQGFVALTPQTIESIQEFQVSTLLWDAESGRNFGSQVNAVSKTGANAVHGQLYGFFTDDALNARNFFDYGDESDFRRTQAGFVVGAPIVKNRTQIFGSFEYLDIDGVAEQHFATPTLAERALIDYSFFGVEQGTLYDLGDTVPTLPTRYTFATPGANGFAQTPPGRAFYSLYPLPNDPGGPYGANTLSQALPIDGRGVITSARVTHQLSPDHLLNARYNFTGDRRTLPSVNQAIRSTIDARTRTHNLSLVFDSSLSPTLFNQARFSFGRTRLEFPETTPGSLDLRGTSPDDQYLFLDPDNHFLPGTGDTGTIGELIIEPYSPVGIDVFTFPQRRASNTFQYADTLAWTRGRHSVKFGADIRRIQLNSAQERNYRPLVTFSNAILEGGFASGIDPETQQFQFVGLTGPRLLDGRQLAAIGLPSSIQQVVAIDPNSDIGLRFTEYDLFVDDNWKVRPNFTLDVGLRYEYNSVPHEVNDKIEKALALDGLADIRDSRFNNPIDEARIGQTLADYRDVLGGRTAIYDDDPNNFGGQIGFAWDPFSTGETSIRGGFGVTFDTIPGAVVNQSRNLFPNETAFNITPQFLGIFDFASNIPANLSLFNGDRSYSIPIVQPRTGNTFGGTPADFLAQVANLGQQGRNGSGIFGGITFTLPEKDLATPYAEQWHLTVERSLAGGHLVSAAYVGTKGAKLLRLTTPNFGAIPTTVLPLIVSDSTTAYTSGPPIVLTQQGTVRDLTVARPKQGLPAYQVYESSAASTYHALQLELRKRYSRGYSYSVAYTWSHAIDDVSDVFGLAGAPIVAQNSQNLRLERADANFDARHRFAASLVYDLPFYRDETGAGATLFGGWQIASIFQTSTGQPFTLNVAFDGNLDGNLTDRPTTTEGLTFLHEHGPRRVAIDPGFGITKFVILNLDGAVGRNTVRGDRQINWDLSLNKTFAFTERHGLELRTELFNVLNRANFGLPIRVIGSPGFGSAVETASQNRVLQFALKFGF